MTRGNTGATLAALLAAVVAAAHCAPSGGDAGTTTATELPQWHNPCGMMAKSAHALRHGKTGEQKEVKDLLAQVRMQFQRAKSMLLDKLSPRVTQLYGNVPSFENISLPWLEFNHFDWYKKNVRNLHIKEKASSVLKRMHVSMQTMLATIHSVQQLKSFGKHLEPRKELLIEVRSEVNAMLCESEVALLKLNATVPERVSIDVVAWDAATNDDTQLQLKDSGVLDKLERSVKGWLRVLNDMLSTRPRGKGNKNKNKNKGKGGKGKLSRTRTTRKPRRK